jgi:hypothetical protein
MKKTNIVTFSVGVCLLAAIIFCFMQLLKCADQLDNDSWSYAEQDAPRVSKETAKPPTNKDDDTDTDVVITQMVLSQ